jgi:peptidoglycan/LPS O-acetylase OafA/YrhL
MATSHRFNTLDGMRGIAAIAVMLYHLTQHSSYGIFPNSNLAVDLFFCLSGFVVAFSYLDRLQGSMTVKEFIVKRLIRLYPMFFFGLCLGIIALLLKYLSGQTNLSISQVVTAISLNALYLPFISDFYVQVGNDMRIPDQTGHAFHGKLDSHSSANWTLIPRQTGQ